MSEYKYSNIKDIEVKNFRNIVDTKISFEESPIVCLVGDNEAGKTSFNMAVSVLAGHKNPREQKTYIRDDTNGFGILLNLDNGYEITRIKSDNLNGYLIKKDGEVVYQTSKLGEGLPVQVKDLMGIIEEDETGEFLQFRTYEDNVLFAYTSASTNYKMVYGALKVEQLTKAITLGNKEANELKSLQDRLEIACGTVMGQLKYITIIDTSNLEKVVDRVNDMVAKQARIKNLVEESKLIERMEKSIPDVSQLHEVENINLLKRIERVVGLLEASKKDKISTDGIETIDNINLLEKVDHLRDILADSQEEVIDVSNLKELDMSEVSKLKAIENLIKQKNRVMEEEKALSALREEQEALDRDQEHLIEELRANGIKIITCPKCGEAIPFDEREVMG